MFVFDQTDKIPQCPELSTYKLYEHCDVKMHPGLNSLVAYSKFETQIGLNTLKYIKRGIQPHVNFLTGLREIIYNIYVFKLHRVEN